MKPFVNKSLFVVSLLLVGNLFFSSCNKDKNDIETPSIPLLSTMSSFDKDGVLDEMTSYQYDKDRRLTKMISNNGSYDLLEYSASTVTEKSYKDEKLDYAAVATLNNKGLCTSVSADDEYYLSTNDYDINDYLKTSTSESATRIQNEWRTISDGNYVAISSENNPKTTKSATLREFDLLSQSRPLKLFIRKFMSKTNLKSTADNNEKREYQFYTNKTNTIEGENCGVSFNGKQNKNPIKQVTFTYFQSGQPITETTTYTYEYDMKDRITKQISSEGDYSIYTYLD